MDENKKISIKDYKYDIIVILLMVVFISCFVIGTIGLFVLHEPDLYSIVFIPCGISFFILFHMLMK